MIRINIPAMSAISGDIGIPTISILLCRHMRSVARIAAHPCPTLVAQVVLHRQLSWAAAHRIRFAGTDELMADHPRQSVFRRGRAGGWGGRAKDAKPPRGSISRSGGR